MSGIGMSLVGTVGRVFPGGFGVYNGSIYYVNFTSGSDSNSGTAPLLAWKTIAKVNSFSFSPLDVILFKRGETWVEELIPPVDSLYLGAYDIGSLPVVDGGGVRLNCINLQGKVDFSINDLKVYRPVDSGIVFNSGSHVVNRVTADASLDQNFQCVGTSSVTINDSTITNAADDGVSGHSSSAVVVNRCTFQGNVQGINTTISGISMTVNDSEFISNTTNDILVDTTTTLVVNRSKFRGMSGGLKQSIGGWGTYNYCSFDFSDSPQQTQIASIYVGKALDLNNCVFYGWSGSANGAGLTVVDGATMNIVNCILDRVWRLLPLGAGVFNANYCDIYLPTLKTLTTEANIIGANGNPFLVDPANRDFRLQAISPCLNVGLYLALLRDLGGNAVGNPPDVGAYEFQG